MIISSSADELGVRAYLRDMQTILDRIDPAPVAAAIAALHAARLAGRQVFIMGNGGSASTASHMVCDLLHRAHRGRPFDAGASDGQEPARDAVEG